MPNLIITERLERILESIQLILERTSHLKSPEDFTKDELQVQLMDSVAMRLQVIGEHVKRISKEDASFIDQQIGVDADAIIRFRDFISHHYEKTDYEIIFDICKHHIPLLKIKIDSYLSKT
ncbi:MAG: DUF86 domain-containing protein [Bacteroidia bacterium]|nr:DUF86 domain-containing protein [Bacteroidia bacterium]